MLCSNCGAYNQDGTGVCSSCGAALTPEASSGSVGQAAVDKVAVGAAAVDGVAVDKAVTAEAAGDNKRMIGIIAVCVAAVVAIAVVVILIMALGSSPKSVAKKFIMASMDPKGGKDLVALMPKEAIEEIMDEEGYDNKSEMIRDANDSLENLTDEYTEYFGKNYKVKVEVRKVTEWKNSQIKEYNKELDDEKIDMTIQAGADVELKVTVTGKNEKETYKPTVSVFKVGGRWYAADGVWAEPYETAYMENHR